MASGDPIRIVESAYELLGDDEAWLSRLVEVAAPLGLGIGAYAFTYDVRKPGHPLIGPLVGSGRITDMQLGRASLEAMPPPIFDSIFGPGPLLGIASEQLSVFPEAVSRMVRQMWAAGGIHDHVGVKGWDPSGEAVILAFAFDKPPQLNGRLVTTLSRIAVHLSAGIRLRRALQGWLPGPDEPGTEAVLDPAGKVEHASDAARDSGARANLTRAVLAMERARGPLRQASPDTAVAIWHGLVDGRWSLIDHYESDGKRYLLARRNDPAVPDPRALGERERQVLAFVALGHSNKLIGYELGLTPSTVAGHIHSILDKLKLKSRRELIQMFGTRSAAARGQGDT